MEDYRLIYHHKETGKKYLVKMVTRLDYVLLDPETMVKTPISRGMLSKNYISAPENKIPQNKNKLKFRRRLTKSAA